MSPVIAKTPKPLIVLLAITLVAVGVATILSLFHYNQEKDSVALAAVQKLSDKPVRIDVADENNDYYITNGQTIWVTKMAEQDGHWVTQSIDKLGSFE